MNDLMTRRELLGAALPAGFAAMAALHPALPEGEPDAPEPEGESRVAARWVYGGYEGTYILAVGRKPHPTNTCHGSLEGVMFSYQPGKTQWYFRVGPAVWNFEAPDLASAKKVAEQYMVEEVRRCLVELEKLAFALRRA